MNRTLHFYSNGRKVIEIFDTDKKTLLYRVDMQRSKPNITVSRVLHKDTSTTGDLVPIGTVTHHSFSSKMDVEISGCPPFTMQSGFMSSRYRINLPQLSGEWSSKRAMSNDLVFQTSAGTQGQATYHRGHGIPGGTGRARRHQPRSH
ncbi:hypothetical protein NQ176_g9193 [Zarea fungicola]|uniref:Uncharacterized protein n=1 Tax=Zarea fungicola TaxID=93591 RepID=A0ACC1MPF2_9HYPO|nr:hypothetical protein NQ176_g9193 [Lecanicillium fungicola]